MADVSKIKLGATTYNIKDAGAARSTHTHDTSIATSTGTSALTMSHGGKYALTAGGDSFIFTLPADSNTDTKVTQTATTTDADYEVLFSATADNTTRTETVRKDSGLIFNPADNVLGIKGTTSANATIDGVNPKIRFSNGDGSQFGYLVFSDNDSIDIGTSLTYISDESNAWLRAPSIRATSGLYSNGTLNVTGASTLNGAVTAKSTVTTTGKLQAGTSTTSTAPSAGIAVHDTRDYTWTPTSLSNSVNWYFTMANSPNTSQWWSIMHMTGWTGDYNSWELAGPSHNTDERTTPLYVRSGRTTNGWGSWRKIYDSSNKPTLSELGAAASGHTHSFTPAGTIAVQTAGTTTSITPVTSKTVVTGVTKKTVVTGGSTTNVPNISKKTVVTSASGATAAVANCVLTITNGSFDTGDSVTVGTAIKAYTSLTTGDSVDVTTGASVTTGTAVTVKTGDAAYKFTGTAGTTGGA